MAFTNTNTNANANTTNNLNKVSNLVLYAHEIRTTKSGGAVLRCSFSSKRKDGTYSKSLNTDVIVSKDLANSGVNIPVPGTIKVSGGMIVDDYTANNGTSYINLKVFAESVSTLK